MNANQISIAAEQARESARQTSGRFGEHAHQKPNCSPLLGSFAIPTHPISETQFDELYDPQQNNAGEVRFTADEAAAYPTEQVWTLCDGDRDGEEFAIAGFDESTPGSMYTITQKPWDFQNQTAIFVTAEADRPENRAAEVTQAATPVKQDINTPAVTKLFSEAGVFQKSAVVNARQAKAGERIHTVVGEDALLETSNTAQEGDWIVTNPGGEEYIIPKETFASRYSATGEDGVFQANGRIRAVKNPFGSAIEITAPWGEPQFGDENCYIAVVVDDEDSPLGDNRYIIEDEAFHTTYHPLSV